MNEPVWLDEAAVLLLHAESLSEHGGPEGVRDIGLLRSAMARPQNLLSYGGEVDLAALARPMASASRATTRSSTATSARPSSPPPCCCC